MSRTSVLVVGSLAGAVLVWVPGVAPAHAEPVEPTYSRVDVNTGPNPNAVAVGDLDADGDQDLVTADLGANAIRILTRDSDGTYQFNAPISTQVGNGGFAPTSVAIGDLDADGDQDIVTANLSGDVTVLTRGTDGTYDASSPVTVGGAPYSVAIGDLDGDGDQDLATANRDSSSVSLLSRDPAGAYTRTDVSVAADGPLSVAIGDLDGDGDQDLATANADSDSVTVLTRAPGGTYSSTVTGVGEYPSSVAIGDLDGDGDQDLAISNARSDSVGVLTRGAGGTYTAIGVGSPGSYPYSVAIGDVDGDGDQDLVSANGGSDDITVLTRGSAGDYTAAVAGTTGTNPLSVAIDDLDRDGDQDLVTANAGSSNVTVLTNTAAHRPPNYYVSAIAGTTGTGPYDVSIGDLDTDGDQDLVTVNRISDTVTVLARGAGGAYTSAVAGTTGDGSISVAIGDLDGDGDQDIVTANLLSNDVTVLARGARGAYTSAVVGTTGDGPISVAIGDLDGDGDQDIVTANYRSNDVTVLTRGAGGVYTSAVVGTTGATPYSVAIGDLDGDGDQDLATANVAGNNVTILTRGAGGSYTSTVAGTTGDNPQSVAIGDLDGDGDQDLATANGSANTVTVLTRGAGGAYASTVAGTTGENPVSVAIGDLDGDGDQDVATANLSSNNVTVLTATRDDTAPKTTDDVPAAPRNAAVPVTLSATDGDSGVKEIRYSVGTNPGTPTTLYNPASKPTLGNGQSIRYFAIDNAGNAETAHTSIPAQVDTTRPSVTLTAPAGSVGGQFTVTATFSEPVTGLTASDFVVGNGTLSGLTGSGNTYAITVTPAADGAVTVALPAGAATDAAANTSTAAAQLTRTADLTRPSVTLSAPAGPVGGPFTVTATFSEAVTGLTVSDFTVDNGTAGALSGSGDTYTVTVTPTAGGVVTVDLPAGAAADAAANTSTAATQLTRTADLTRPSVTLSAPVGPVGGAFTVTATFSEAVTGLTASDVIVGNGTASDLTGSGSTYTLTVTPTADGTVEVDLPAGSATDGADNANTAATQLTRTADLTRPTVALSAPAGNVSGPFTVTATFSEAVTGLTVSDVVVDNGTAADLTGSGSTYTVTVTPTSTGQISIDLPAGSATDAAGNPNAVAPRLSRTVVQPSFTNGPDASISGTPVVGGTLTAATGTTTPAAESFTYLWAADGTPIAGATASTLTLDAAQLDRTITVEVTATRTGYVDAADTSAPTSQVAAGTFTPGPTASVSGTARGGQTLTATTGSPVPSPDSYAYAWYADDVAIAGATGRELVLSASQAGRRISVEVTARRAGYTDAVSRSAATDLVTTDQAPLLTLRVTVPRKAGQTVDGTTVVRQRAKVTIAWAATGAATVRPTGALGDVLAKRYPDGAIPTSGRITVTLKRIGLHQFRMAATGTGGTTSAYAAATVERAPKRLRVEVPTVVRSGQKTTLRVSGLGRRERYRITLTRPGSRTPLARIITGRANKAGVIQRRILVPELATGKQQIVVTVIGGPRRTGSSTVRVR